MTMNATAAAILNQQIEQIDHGIKMIEERIVLERDQLERDERSVADLCQRRNAIADALRGYTDTHPNDIDAQPASPTGSRPANT